MDAELRSLMTKTCTVRRGGAVGRYLNASAFTDAVVLPCYFEQRQRRVMDATGTVVKTMNVIVFDAADVSASSLLTLSRDDFFWPYNVDADDFTKAAKPTEVVLLDDPETGLASHYEVTL